MSSFGFRFPIHEKKKTTKWEEPVFFSQPTQGVKQNNAQENNDFFRPVEKKPLHQYQSPPINVSRFANHRSQDPKNNSNFSKDKSSVPLNRWNKEPFHHQENQYYHDEDEKEFHSHHFNKNDAHSSSKQHFYSNGYNHSAHDPNQHHLKNHQRDGGHLYPPRTQSHVPLNNYVEQGLYHQQDHYPNSSYAPALASKDFLNPNREEEGSSKVVVVKPQPLSSSDRLKKYKRFIPQNYLAKFLTILISVFVGVVFGWFIYQWTKMEEITGADGIAIITPVRNQSYRVKPKEPGGKTIPHQNLSIFDDPSNVDSLDAQGGESLLQEPEEDIQYLIAQKDPVIEDGQNTNSNGYPNHIDELTQSQNRPRHHDEVYSSVPQRPEKEDIVRTAYTPPPLKKEPNYHNGEEGYDESTQDSMTSLPASVDYVDTEKRSLSAASNPPVSREPVGYLVETDHGPVIVKNPNHQGGRISRPRGNGHETKNNDVLLSADQDSSELQSDTLLSQQPQRSTNDFSKSMSIAENDPNIVEEKKTVEPISKTLPPLIIKENFYIQIAEGIKSEAQGVNHWKKLSEKPDVRKMLSTYEGILKFDTNAKKYYLLLGPFSVKDSLKAQKISQKLNVKFLQKYID